MYHCLCNLTQDNMETRNYELNTSYFLSKTKEYSIAFRCSVVQTHYIYVCE